MKLFDEGFRYNEHARELDLEIGAAVNAILERYIQNGCSPREVEYVANSCITINCLGALFMNPKFFEKPKPVEENLY